MKVKTIGIGKCGSRVIYDLFAYISGTPTAYDLRVESHAGVLSYLVERFPMIGGLSKDVVKSGLTLQQLFQELFGEFLIYDPPIFVTLDSDIRNNEIISWLRFIDGEGKSSIFPGKSFELADHVGGCHFHIVSENICVNWSDIDREIISDDGADFIATAFSVGGGTGGGAAPIISRRCKEQYESKHKKSGTEQMHFMGIGILPESDEPYHGEEYIPDMSPNERYNTGRFFANLYGRRNAEDPQLDMDGVWLVGNDGLRVAAHGSRKDADEMNLSLINRYVAASLTVICNASSRYSKSHPNFDPSEMNSVLNGYPFMSGYAACEPEKAADESSLARNVREVLEAALTNMALNDFTQLQGLSIPVREADLAEVRRILNEPGVARLRDNLKTYKMEEAPLEFQTAASIAFLYGQPQDTHSRLKDELVRDIVSTLFKNSRVEPYYYQYEAGNLDKLLVLIINPFIRLVHKSLYYYAQISWVNELAGQELFKAFDEVILERPFNRGKIEGLLLDNEQIHTDFHGESIVQLVNSFPEPRRLGREQVINAFEHLHQVYHSKKPPPPDSVL